MKTIATISIALLIASSAFADSYRVHYSIAGSGRDITVQAESSDSLSSPMKQLTPQEMQRRSAASRWSGLSKEAIAEKQGAGRWYTLISPHRCRTS
jgi:hypothetical protein